MVNINKDKIKVIAFDADDTLWVNEDFFRSAEAHFYQILESYIGKKADGKDFTEELCATIDKTLHIYGYGAKSFMLAMIETALELTNYKITGEDIQKIINLGKEILSYEIDIFPTIEATLKDLQDHYRVICITKGDLLDQESKIARSGLGKYFSDVHVVNEKNPMTYQRIQTAIGVKPEEFVMVGNSLKSDILPVTELGSAAFYIPVSTQWIFEHVDEDTIDDKKYIKLKEAGEILNYLV